MSFKTWLRNNFGAGALVLVPLLGTIALFSWLFNTVTRPGFDWLMKRFRGEEYAIIREFLDKNELLFRLAFLFLMLGLTVLIGALARNFIGRRIIRLGETFLERIPIVRRVYIAFKQIGQAFWGENKTVFSHVVAVEYPRKGLYTVGFVTWASRGEVKDQAGRRLLNVFLPTTPNPTSGWFVVVTEEQTTRLDMSVEDAMKMIVSGGAVVPELGKAVTVLGAKIRGEEKAPQEERVPTSQPG